MQQYKRVLIDTKSILSAWRVFLFIYFFLSIGWPGFWGGQGAGLPPLCENEICIFPAEFSVTEKKMLTKIADTFMM